MEILQSKEEVKSLEKDINENYKFEFMKNDTVS